MCEHYSYKESLHYYKPQYFAQVAGKCSSWAVAAVASVVVLVVEVVFVWVAEKSVVVREELSLLEQYAVEYFDLAETALVLE